MWSAARSRLVAAVTITGERDQHRSTSSEPVSLFLRTLVLVQMSGSRGSESPLTERQSDERKAFRCSA